VAGGIPTGGLSTGARRTAKVARRQIATIARQQVEEYKTVTFFRGFVVAGRRVSAGWEVEVVSGEAGAREVGAQEVGAQEVGAREVGAREVGAGEVFRAGRLVFATGIRDILPSIEGLSGCWGISVLHCPYCHGYEVGGEKTGILANGDGAFEMATLISNWTPDLTVFTNGSATLTPEQLERLAGHGIGVVDKSIARIVHFEGYAERLVFTDGSMAPVKALYTRAPFVQHCMIPAGLGCELTEEGYIKVDAFQETSLPGVYACGDNASRMRTVAHAVAAGTMTGIAISRKMIFENF